MVSNIVRVLDGSKQQSQQESSHVVFITTSQCYHESGVYNGYVNAMDLRPKQLNSIRGVVHGPHHQHYHHKRVAVEVETDERRKDHQEDDRKYHQPGKISSSFPLVDPVCQFGSSKVSEDQLEGENEAYAAEVEDSRDGPPQREFEECLGEGVCKQVGIE